MTRARALRSVAPVMLALLLAGCETGPGAPQPVLRIAHETEVLSLDPTAVVEAGTHSVLSNFYEGLVAFDLSMKLVPALATSWSTVNERVWVISLRPGVRFHDGTLLTASEVAKALEYARTDPGSAVQGHLASIDSIEATDQLTLRIVTRTPDALLLGRLSYVLVVRRGAQLAGTGPYRVTHWERGQPVEAEAFAGHWRGRPAIARVTFSTPPEDQRIAALKQGSVDVLRWVPENRVQELRGVPHIRTRIGRGLVSHFLWFNTAPLWNGARNPFADRRVRRAVSLALDRRDLIATALKGNGLPANQLVPAGVFGHVAGLPDLGSDVEQSRQLLHEAGFPQGFAADLASPDGTLYEGMLAAIAGNLSQAGIHVRTSAHAWAPFVEAWKRAQMSAFLASWRFEDGDAAGFLKDCLYTRDAGHGAFNPGVSLPGLDLLVDENVQVIDPRLRLAHYEKIMDLVREEMPVVPLYNRLNLYGASDRVRWEPRLDGKLLAAEMSWQTP